MAIPANPGTQIFLIALNDNFSVVLRTKQNKAMYITKNLLYLNQGSNLKP